MGNAASVSVARVLCAGDGGRKGVSEGPAACGRRPSGGSGDADRQQQRHHAGAEQSVPCRALCHPDPVGTVFPEPEKAFRLSRCGADGGRFSDGGGAGDRLSGLFFLRRRDLRRKKGCKSGKQCYTDRYEDQDGKRRRPVRACGLCECPFPGRKGSRHFRQRAGAAFHPGHAAGHLSLLAGSGYLSGGADAGGAGRPDSFRAGASRGDRL